jgi:flagellar biogenesis protein FliO
LDLIRPVLSILTVLGLLLLMLWFLKSRGLVTAGKGRRLQSLERLALSPQHSIHLVLVDSKEVLLALHPGGCTVLPSEKLHHLGAAQ